MCAWKYLPMVRRTGGQRACFFFRSGKIEVLRKFWKRKCVEKLKGIETETPEKSCVQWKMNQAWKEYFLVSVSVFHFYDCCKRKDQNPKVSPAFSGFSQILFRFLWKLCQGYFWANYSDQTGGWEFPQLNGDLVRESPQMPAKFRFRKYSTLPRCLSYFAVDFLLCCLLRHAPSFSSQTQTPCRSTGPGAGNGSNTDPDSNVSITRCLRERISVTRWSWSYQLHVE